MEKAYLKGLNDKQKEAVLHTEGPLLILAGAGSGKTNTMTKRIAHLIQGCGVPYYKILAVTFTNKAAEEMQQRVEAVIGSGQKVWIKTFHASALRILRVDADLLGYEARTFSVYDPTDQKTVVKEIFKKMDIQNRELTVKTVLNRIEKAKQERISPAEYIGFFPMDRHAEAIAEIYMSYEKALMANNAMDFNDLLNNAVKLLKAFPEVRSYWQDKFEYIMVDEYQDTNRAQYDLIKILSARHKNLAVVGDDDQCIYEWRGASMANILDFEEDYPDAKIIKLERNYRSTGNILQAAHSVIKNNNNRRQKKLWTDFEAGEKILYASSENEKEEAQKIANEIEARVEDGRYEDFAILYRINALSRIYEEVLHSRRIPYKIVGGIKYYDRKEVKDVVAYLRLIANPDDDVAFNRVVNEPARGIGPRSVQLISSWADQANMSMLTASLQEGCRNLLRGKAKKSLENFSNIIKKYIDLKDEMAVTTLYDRVLDDVGYIRVLEEDNTVESDSRLENILEFRSVLQEYSQKGIDTLEECLAELSLLTDTDKAEEEKHQVSLMTIHSAKGLEFPMVFLPAFEQDIFPGKRTWLEADRIEEERRLCYVAITRAERSLMISTAESRMLYGERIYNIPSQFLEEIDPALIQENESLNKTRRLIESFDGITQEEPFPSLDVLASAKNKVRRSNKAGRETFKPIENLKAGETVDHRKFGEGTVINSKGDIAEVIFDSVGIKKLKVSMAPMKRK